jgi:hypothetical protein
MPDPTESVTETLLEPEQPIKSETLYKLGTPHYAPEPDWTITLNRREFPWNEIKVSDFSTSQCYKMYRELIPDEFAFNKSVRGESFNTFKKLI